MKLKSAGAAAAVLTVVPAQASISLSSSVSTSPLPSAARNLEPQCTENIESQSYDADPEHAIGNPFDKYSQGKLGRRFVESLRDKPKSFYEDILDDLIMMTCDVEATAERCVYKLSSKAAKDLDGSCLVAADQTCPEGTCERVSNCYWNPVEPGMNRKTRFPRERYAGARNRLLGHEWSSDSYARGLLSYLAPGVIIAALLLMFWFFFFVGRCCCCCLWNRWNVCFFCSPLPKRGGYRKCRDVVLPCLLYFITSSGIVISSAITYIGNEDINIGASSTFYHASGLIENFEDFLERSRKPIDAIQNIIYDAAADATAILAGTDYIRTTAISIADSFSDYSHLYLNGLVASDAQDVFDSAHKEFQEKIMPISDHIQVIFETLELGLRNNTEKIQSTSESAIDTIDFLSSNTKSWQNNVDRAEDLESKTRTYRKLGVLGMLLSSLTVTLGGAIGIVSSRSRKHRCMHKLVDITGIICAVLSPLLFVSASVSLTSSVVWNDACQVIDLVTADFEPFIGEKASEGVNAAFNGESLLKSFHFDGKIDFQSEFDEGLRVIEAVNIKEKFEFVLSPLGQIENMIDGITYPALSVINQGTTLDSESCPFNDEYNKDNILEPWLANKDKTSTLWMARSTGTAETYVRSDFESNTDYIARLYANVAGYCSTSDDCCLEGTCGIAQGQVCNGGDSCVYPCASLGDLITSGYAAYLYSYKMEQAMAADLGFQCPIKYDTCPTMEFLQFGHSQTLVDSIETYEDSIRNTAKNLKNAAATSVGDIMEEVQDLRCNMNVTFVERWYDLTKRQVCGKMLGGFAQVNWGLWALALFLQVVAILSTALSSRLHMNRKESNGSHVTVRSPTRRRRLT